MMTRIFAWIILRQWWLIGGFYLLSITGAVWKTWEWRDQVCAQSAAVKVVEGVKQHAKKVQKIRRLDDDDLVRRYCRWVYDIPYDECVRTVVPLK